MLCQCSFPPWKLIAVIVPHLRQILDGAAAAVKSWLRFLSYLDTQKYSYYTPQKEVSAN